MKDFGEPVFLDALGDGFRLEIHVDQPTGLVGFTIFAGGANLSVSLTPAEADRLAQGLRYYTPTLRPVDGY